MVLNLNTNINYNGKFRDVNTNVNDRTNLDLIVLDRKKIMDNNIVERLKNLLVVRFDNNLNNLAQFLNKSPEFIHQILSGEITPDTSMFESKEEIQIGDNNKIINVTNELGSSSVNNVSDTICDGSGDCKDKSEIHALNIRVACLEKMLKEKEKYIEEKNTYIVEYKKERDREISTLKDVIKQLKKK